VWEPCWSPAWLSEAGDYLNVSTEQRLLRCVQSHLSLILLPVPGWVDAGCEARWWTEVEILRVLKQTGFALPTLGLASDESATMLLHSASVFNLNILFYLLMMWLFLNHDRTYN